MEDLKDQVLFVKGIPHEEAVVLLGALEADGIDAFLKSENLGGHIPGGVNNYIFVPEKDLERAKKIRAELDASQPLFRPTRRKTWPRRLLLLGAWLFSLFVIGAASFNAGKRTAEIAENGPSRSALKTTAEGARYYEEDTDGDGQPDVKHLVDKEERSTESRYDRNHDGTDDMLRAYHLDGHVVREEQDTDYDGKMDRFDDVDANGRTTHARFDFDGDGTVDSESWYDEDENVKKTITLREGKVAEEDLFEGGVIHSSIVDTNRDGVFDTEIRYDDFGVFIEARKMKAK